MSADIFSLRVLLVTPAASLSDLLRTGVCRASIPAEVGEANDGAAAEPLIAQGIDLIFLDGGMEAQDKAIVCKAARSAKERPFIVCVGRDSHDTGVDGSVHKPVTEDEARRIADDCIRARLPTRVLIVDDSSTMRGIVRKILSASRFPMEVFDTRDCATALQDLCDGIFDVVFLDCNMPDFDGFELLSELRRLQSSVAVVMMTATDNPSVAARAQEAGATAFLKKPFFPADVDAALYRLYNIEAPARRW